MMDCFDTGANARMRRGGCLVSSSGRQFSRCQVEANGSGEGAIAMRTWLVVGGEDKEALAVSSRCSKRGVADEGECGDGLPIGK